MTSDDQFLFRASLTWSLLMFLPVVAAVMTVGGAPAEAHEWVWNISRYLVLAICLDVLAVMGVVLSWILRSER